MRTWLEAMVDRLRTSLWFIPLAMCAASGALAVGLILLDLRVSVEEMWLLGWVRISNMESLYTILSTILGALITVLSVVFSITIVSLTLAASQLGPRLLRNFTRDTGNQIVLGVFVATSLYCLLVLYISGRYEEARRVPNIAATGALALTVTCLVMLVYFIHHISDLIQAPRVVAAVAAELDNVIDTHTCEADSPDEEAAIEAPELPESGGVAICSARADYVQAVNVTELLALAARRDLVIRVIPRPGDFVSLEAPLARIYGDGRVTEKVQEKVRKAFFFGMRRTATQDIEFVIQELVEVALRALSPSLNDPFTAITCIDRLGNAIARLMRRRLPSRCRLDKEGRVRVLLDQPTFPGICDAAFNQLRQHSTANAAVTIRLLEVIRRVLIHARTQEQRDSLWRHAQLVHENATGLAQEADRRDAEERFARIKESLARPISPSRTGDVSS